jgi:hypothetical protein
MAVIIVEIHIPDTKLHQLDKDPDWFPGDGKIVIDDAYLTRFKDDDSFFEFKFLGMRED